jgi:hypothetical protein
LSPPPAFHIPTPSRADASWNRRAATMSPIILREFSAVRNEVRGIRATQLRWSGSLACQTKLGRRGDLWQPAFAPRFGGAAFACDREQRLASPTGAALMYSEDSIRIELAGHANEQAASALIDANELVLRCGSGGLA